MNDHVLFTTSMLALLLACAVNTAQAGRPLATDDASTADKGTCQFEAWVEGAHSDRTYVVAPACGVADGVELGGDVSKMDPSDGVVAEAGLAAKWVPEKAQFDTALGKLILGAKLSVGNTRLSGGSWRVTGVGGSAVVTLEVNPDVKMHLNVGPDRARQDHLTSTALNAAIEWASVPAALLIAEVLANDSRDVNGGAVRTAGVRWWVVPDVFGLDLTASREAGSGGPTLWSVGLGWYGLGGK